MRRGPTHHDSRRSTRGMPAWNPVGEPGSLKGTMGEYLEWLRVRGRTEMAVYGYSRLLRGFSDWCEERELLWPEEVTRPIVERYQRHLFYWRQKNGRPLSAGSQRVRLNTVRQYFRWLVRSDRLLHNPCSELVMPKGGFRLPRVVLTAEEVEKVLAVPDVSTPFGLRDRAMLEVFYSTGIRRAELVALSVFDVRGDLGTVMVRQGKGRKDRVVPIGERAMAWVSKYLDEARPKFVFSKDVGTLFLSETGEMLSLGQVTMLARRYVKKSGVSEQGACHLFRHAMATQMLENGADIRFVQEMLGHASLETTQIYTHVSIRKLKEIHAATHPSAKLERKREVAREGREADLDEREALLSALAVEDDEEQSEPEKRE